MNNKIYKCIYCRRNLGAKVGHRCRGTFRKRNLNFINRESGRLEPPNIYSELYPEQIELRLLEKIADDIILRNHPALGKTSQYTLLKYFEKLIQEKTNIFLSR